MEFHILDLKAVDLKKKIIFFGDNNNLHVTPKLFKIFLENINDQFELIAIVNTTNNNKSNKLKSYLIYLIKKLFNPFDKNIILNNSVTFLELIPENILLLQTENINNLEFIDKIKILNPDYAFLMGCPQIFKKNIINCFDKIVNYHNSYLPTYRGLEATSWAMTYYEKYTGYTFHYINEKIDAGKIIFQEKIDINYSKSSFENELLKAKKASENISKVLTLVLNKFEGTEQIGKQSYYSAKQKRKLLLFIKLDNIKKIQRLIKIWGGVQLLSKNEIIFITKVANDGKIKRIKWLPPKVYFILKIAKFLYCKKYR